MEKVWGAKLEEAQSKLRAAEAELSTQKQMITQMLTAVLGKCSMCFFIVMTHLCSVMMIVKKLTRLSVVNRQPCRRNSQITVSKAERPVPDDLSTVLWKL